MSQKNCAFHNPQGPMPYTYSTARDLQSPQRNASVHLLLLAGHFEIPIEAKDWRGGVPNNYNSRKNSVRLNKG